MAFVLSWSRVLRRTLRVLAVLAGLLLLGWLGLVWYINSHKQELLVKISKELSERLHGDMRIGSLEPSVFRSFPTISLSLNDVSLHDSLWAQHKHSLLEAKNLYVRIRPLALFSRRVEIEKIIAAHGSIFLYTDAKGYSNSYLLERRDTSKKNRPALVDHFGLEDMHFWFVNEAKQKLFHFLIKELDGTSSRSSGIINTHLATSMHVYSMAFSTIRGSYLKDQDMSFKMDLSYKIADKHLHVPQQELRISGTPVLFGADFYFNRTPSAFEVHLRANDIPYKKALAWTSDNIQRVLQPYSFQKPLTMDIRVSGVMQFRNIPLIKIIYDIKDNTLVTPVGDINKLTYSGEYYNQVSAAGGHGDNNSRVALYGLTGEWRGIPFSADTISVVNLLQPIVDAHLRSSFPVRSLNNVVGSTIMSFQDGTADADLRYKGAIRPDDTAQHFINGHVRVAGASLTYLPRSLAFSNVGATLLFEGDNLFFRNITMRSRQSSLAMEGDALHFLRLYFSDPGKVTLAWRARSPLVNLNDFMGLLAKRRVASPVYSGNRGNAVTRISSQLDRVLAEGSFSLDARINRVLYKSFVADDVIAKLLISQSGIVLQEAQVRNGGGSLNIRGVINQTAPNNPFQMKAVVRTVDVAKLFSSFNNFGQNAISAENLAGLISADADVSGNITDAGAVVENSFNGNVSFKLQNGQLNRFAPLEKIGKVVFKKRNLSAVQVKELQGQLDIRGSKILIRPMDIQTSALNMSVQGVYGLRGGTDIFIEVPLRNPAKEGANTPIGMLLRTGKGIVLHLRAQDPTGTGVKIGWDPLRHGRKATKEELSEE